jgi:hypothetical protein
MLIGLRDATSNRDWAPRRTKESHLRLVGFFCCLEGATIDFVNGLLNLLHAEAVAEQEKHDARQLAGQQIIGFAGGLLTAGRPA